MLTISQRNPAPDVDNVVLCYVNIGAIEQYEADYSSFPQDAIGNSYEDYPEGWIDVRREDVVEFMKKRLVKAAEIGCDGIDADNIDGYVSFLLVIAAIASSVIYQRGP